MYYEDSLKKGIKKDFFIEDRDCPVGYTDGQPFISQSNLSLSIEKLIVIRGENNDLQ